MTIGSQLKKAREKKQVSIDEAYQHTRILPEMLSALEEDNFARVTSPIYLKSFLREYSSYLGLNPENILNEYKSLKAKEAVSKPESTTANEELPARKIDTEKTFNILKVVLKIILTVLLLILFVKTTGWVKHKFLSWRSTRAEETKQAISKSPVKQKKIDRAPKALKTSEALKKPAQVVMGNVLIPQDEKLTLSIRTTDDVWIELRIDGKIIFKNVLKGGSEEEWQADENFELWTGNAAAMNIRLNGHDLGSPGAGVKKGIIINRQGIQK